MRSFSSPSELREQVLLIANELEDAELTDAANLLREGANYCTSSGWEWIGELSLAVRTVRDRFPLSPETRKVLDEILTSSTSTRPYS